MLIDRFHTDAGTAAEAIGAFDLREDIARDDALEIASRRHIHEPGFLNERQQALLVVHPFVIVQVGPLPQQSDDGGPPRAIRLQQQEAHQKIAARLRSLLRRLTLMREIPA